MSLKNKQVTWIMCPEIICIRRYLQDNLYMRFREFRPEGDLRLLKREVNKAISDLINGISGKWNFISTYDERPYAVGVELQILQPKILEYV